MWFFIWDFQSTEKVRINLQDFLALTANSEESSKVNCLVIISKTDFALDRIILVKTFDPVSLREWVKRGCWWRWAIAVCLKLEVIVWNLEARTGVSNIRWLVRFYEIKFLKFDTTKFNKTLYLWNFKKVSCETSRRPVLSPGKLVFSDV